MVDLFASLAAIAGIFVGFGALVVLAPNTDNSEQEQHLVRAVVSIALLTMAGALIPVGLAQYMPESRVLWGISSAAFLAIIWFGLLNKTNRPVLKAMMKHDKKSAAFFWLVLEPAIQVPLFFALFGVFPQFGKAFYASAVIINVFEAALTLVQVVYAKIARST